MTDECFFDVLDKFHEADAVVRDFYLNYDVSKFGLPDKVQQAFLTLAAEARASHEQHELYVEEMARERKERVQAIAQEFVSALEQVAEDGVGDDSLSTALKKVAAFITSLSGRDIPNDAVPGALDRAIAAFVGTKG